MAIENYLIINDVHVPFHCKKSFSIFKKILKDHPPNRLYLNGDIPEFESVSRHTKRPNHIRFLIEEIAETNRYLDDIQKIYKGPITWLYGNHEYRLDRYLVNMAPMLIGSVTCNDAFKIHQRSKFNSISYMPRQLIRCGKSNLYLRHEPVGGGINHAKSTSEKSDFDVAYGHCHTIQSFTTKRLGGFRKRSYALPCMLDWDNENFDYRGPKDNWTKGFTHVQAETKTGHYHLQCVETVDNMCFFDKKIYRA